MSLVRKTVVFWKPVPLTNGRLVVPLLPVWTALPVAAKLIVLNNAPCSM